MIRDRYYNNVGLVMVPTLPEVAYRQFENQYNVDKLTLLLKM